MSYVLATSRHWNEILSTRLEEKLESTFHLITQKDDLTLSQLRKLNPRYVFFPHWSYLIPKEIFQEFECVIFHMTDLPYGRGGSPLQNLIELGHKESKITALRCTEILDGGPIYSKRPLDLQGSAYEIFLRAVDIIESMIEEIIEKKPVPKAQRGEPYFFTRRAPDESNLLDVEFLDLVDFYNFIRMLDAPTYPLAFIDHGDFRLEFSEARLSSNSVEARVSIKFKDDP